LTVIYKYAGRDATKAYGEIHAPSLIAQNLDRSKRIGSLDERSVDNEWISPPPGATKELEDYGKPPLHTLINSHDFESVASRSLAKKTWAFYSSAATDLITREANKTFLDRIWFRPRALIDVKNVSTKSKILGCDVSMPLFIAPAALAKLAHPDGEKALALGCAKTGIAQCVRITIQVLL
jgi:L-lactate dehydrogenase (cytochrome)